MTQKTKPLDHVALDLLLLTELTEAAIEVAVKELSPAHLLGDRDALIASILPAVQQEPIAFSWTTARSVTAPSEHGSDCWTSAITVPLHDPDSLRDFLSFRLDAGIEADIDVDFLTLASVAEGQDKGTSSTLIEAALLELRRDFEKVGRAVCRLNAALPHRIEIWLDAIAMGLERPSSASLH
jgi:hypothetical protein